MNHWFSSSHQKNPPRTEWLPSRREEYTSIVEDDLQQSPSRNGGWTGGRVLVVLVLSLLGVLVVLGSSWETTTKNLPPPLASESLSSITTTTVTPNNDNDPNNNLEKCRGMDWQTACSQLTEAGARRRLDNQHTHNDYSEMEEYLLQDSDDPSVTYDDNCLRVYRLDLFNTTTFPYHANQLLRAGGNQTMALFIQHGAMRNADSYFCSFRALMLEQTYRPFQDILIIAPDFNYKNDPGVLPSDAFWNATKPFGDWRVGAESDPECCSNGFGTHGGKTISSFTILDHMLDILTNKELYPNMDKISFVGHSAGGQMVQRYAMMSKLAASYDTNGGKFDVEFIVANPSSYTYLDDRRWKYNCGQCDCNTNNCTCDRECSEITTLGVPAPNKAGKDYVCYDDHYNQWPYGLSGFSDNKHEIPYVEEAAKHAVASYRERDVVYMVGQNDTCTDNVFPTCHSDCWKKDDFLPEEGPCFRNHMDARCPAILEGPFRRSRGIHYMKYLQNLYGESIHTFHMIPNVGHNATGMFGSDIGLRELFD